MYLTKIVFGDSGDDQCEKSRADLAGDYLAALLHNGQIYGEYYFAPCGGKIVAYTHIARPGAFAKRFHSRWGLASLKEIVEAFDEVPQWIVLQDNVPSRFPSWKKSPSFYLFTHAFDDTSPVCCGGSGQPVPLYLLPVSDQTREDLYFWTRHYKDHDNIWISSGALEMPAYRQTADPNSELSATGLELCQEIEAATGKRTFYYLQRYWGRNVGEENRLCPMCGRRWRTSAKEAEETPFWKFSFRCLRCRLVSHLACSYDDERHAAIGEYARRKGTGKEA
jgi:predicted  nucleic acid-binding Zn ribbon protein